MFNVTYKLVVSSLNIPHNHYRSDLTSSCNGKGHTHICIFFIFQVFPWLHLWDMFMDETTVSFIKNKFLFQRHLNFKISISHKFLQLALYTRDAAICQCMVKHFQMIFKLSVTHELVTHEQVHCGTKTRQSWGLFEIVIITMCSQRSIYFCWNEDSLTIIYNTVLTLDAYILLQNKVVT